MIRRTAANAARLRSRQTVRDAEARARAKTRRKQAGRHWRRLANVAACCGLALVLPGLGVVGEYRYGLVDRTALLVVALDERARTALRDLSG